MNRKVTVLDSGQFPILKIENFLSDTDYNSIKEEVKKYIIELEDMIDDVKPTQDTDRDYHRLYLDEVYQGEDRKKSDILRIIESNLSDKQMNDIYRSLPETAFKLIPFSKILETQLTVYKDLASYGWHNDHNRFRIINYILMIDLGMKFEGGHTQVSNKQETKEDQNKRIIDAEVALNIEPKGNQLIMMPMWVTHRVTPIKMNGYNLSDSRITVNGHIAMRGMNEL
jgi:Rps23 Pro-64 3,4-dihydroxylase Tpa1-like proline 4-hydroxylase